ncbi:hypothetical protein TWF281_007059 [Arthrobotrys megalospora]
MPKMGPRVGSLYSLLSILINSILSILLAQIHQTTAIPHNSTLHRRSLEQGNIWQTETPFLTRACKLGLYSQAGNTNSISGTFAKWEGYPLGMDYDNPVDNNKCHSIPAEIGDPLARYGVWQWYISGYCFCVLFRDDKCGDNPSPPNWSNLVLQGDWSFKPDNRGNYNSFQCRRRFGNFSFGTYRTYPKCTVEYSNGGRHGGFDPIDGIDQWIHGAQEFGQDGLNKTGVGPCISGFEFTLRQWKIKSCTCHFYTDDKCETPPLLTDGNGGEVSREGFEGFGNQKIRSLRCDAPYAPRLVPQDAFENPTY